MQTEIFNDIKEFRYQIFYINNFSDLQDNDDKYLENILYIKCIPKWGMSIEELTKYIKKHLNKIYSVVKSIVNLNPYIYSQFDIDFSKIYSKQTKEVENKVTSIKIRPELKKIKNNIPITSYINPKEPPMA